MTHASMPTSGSPAYPAPQRAAPASESSAWFGWLAFAAIMLILAGMFQIIQGLVAIFDHSFYVVAKDQMVVHLSYTAWGWILLILAAVNISAGFGVLGGKTWARVWAIGAAIVSLLANIGFTAAYPIWTVILVTLDVVVIYALCVHWAAVKSPY